MSRTRFHFWLGTAVAWFATAQLLFVFGVPFHADEFQGAHAAYRLIREVPYRDFLPYKTVLGYAFQLPTLLLAGPGWAGLTAVRLQNVLINAAAVSVLGLILARWYRREAVALSVVLLVFMSTFLDYAFEIRLDMLTGWLGAGALLLLLARRPGWAGGVAGLAFLVSQKAAFYLTAGAAALAVCALLPGRTAGRWLPVVRFVAGAVVVIGVYLAGWIAVAGMDRVLFITFPAAAEIAGRSVYDGIRLRWVRTAIRNPVFYGLALIGLAHFAVRSWRSMAGRSAQSPEDIYRGTILSVFCATVLGQMAVYPQSWSYFFLLVIPALTIMIAAFMSERLPTSAGTLGLSAPTLLAFIVGGVLYPSIYVIAGIHGDRPAQRAAYEAGIHALREGGSYWAGSNVYANQAQPSGLEWLDLYNLERLHSLPRGEKVALIQSLSAAPPAVIIDNYRLKALPYEFRAFIDDNYKSLHGTVLTYVVHVPAGTNVLDPPLEGRFRNIGERSLRIGDVGVGPGALVRLAGSVRVEAPDAGGLQFVGGFDGPMTGAMSPGGEFFGFR